MTFSLLAGHRAGDSKEVKWRTALEGSAKIGHLTQQVGRRDRREERNNSKSITLFLDFTFKMLLKLIN